MTDPHAFVVHATASIAATPEAVFDRISDVTLLGRWSPECTGGEWLTDDRGAGARFVGHNSSHGRTWATECEVLVADRPSEFSWHVVTNTEPRTSIWAFRIEADGAGARVTESFEMRATPRPFRAALDAVPAERAMALRHTRKRELQDGIVETLRRLKAELEDQV